MARENMLRRTGLRLRPAEMRTLLMLVDLLLAYVALLAGLMIWASADPFLDFSLEFIERRVPTWFFFLPLLWIVALIDLYDPHRARSLRRVLRGVLVAGFLGVIGYALFFIAYPTPEFLPRLGVGYFLIGAAILTLLWRLFFIRIFTDPSNLRRVLVVGAGRAGVTLMEVYRKIMPPPFIMVGFIDDDPRKIGKEFHGFNVIAGSKHLLRLISEHDISDLVVAISGEMRGEMFQSLLDAQERGVVIMHMPRVYEELLGRVPIHHLDSDWVIRSFVDDLRVSGFYEGAKRVLDVVFGVVGMLVFLLMLPFIALAIVIDSGMPIFYKQNRLGRGGREFMIYKLRTMRQDAERDGGAKFAAQNDPRITRVGNFLRKTRLDEFPQFLNVISGEMSLIGPRAERPEWVTHFEKSIPFYRARLLVKPGISGWAQVNYGYTDSEEDTAVKLEYDLYYIKHRNLLMDLDIVLRTVGTMLRFKGR